MVGPPVILGKGPMDKFFFVEKESVGHFIRHFGIIVGY
jgi:hypothetical protein